ncbi:MAG: hypothetical protein ACTSWG_03625 [Candidatus Helarchaeota archaeon]
MPLKIIKRKFSANKTNRIFFLNLNTSYNRKEKLIIGITFLMILLGFLLRSWRIIREGMPITFDGYNFQKIAKRIFFNRWYDLSKITRNPPGIYFLLVIAENLFGFGGIPIMWSIYIFPQLVCSLQLIIFYVFVQRLSHSKITALLSMFFMTFLGLIIYRNQNVAPETFVLGLVPFIVYFLFRYLETEDLRFLGIALFISIGIILTHHLSTLFVLVNWHVILFYEKIYTKVKNFKLKRKFFILNFLVLILLDLFVIIFWKFVLNSYPFSFIKNALDSFYYSSTSFSFYLIIFGVVILNLLIFAYMWFNLDKPNFKFAVIFLAVIGCLIVFCVALFFGGASPETSFIASLLMGTPILVLPPLAAFGFVNLPPNRSFETRLLRSWLFSLISLISFTAIIPILSSLLARLALYLIPAGVVLASYAVYRILLKIDRRKLRAVVLLSLIGSVGLTMTFAYPKPANNWGQQEIYFAAEFSTVDFLVNYYYSPNNTVWSPDCPAVIDADLRLSLILEGYGGLRATYSHPRTSWQYQVLIRNETARSEFLQTVCPRSLNEELNFFFFSKVMFIDGYITDWANYGTTKEHWIVKFPAITGDLLLNPYIERIYSNGFTFLLYPKQLCI